MNGHFHKAQNVSQGSERLKRSWVAGSWVSQGISRYLKVFQGKGAGELEIEYLYVSQGISRYLKGGNGSKGAGELEIEYL